MSATGLGTYVRTWPGYVYGPGYMVRPASGLGYCVRHDLVMRMAWGYVACMTWARRETWATCVAWGVCSSITWVTRMTWGCLGLHDLGFCRCVWPRHV